MTFDSKTHWEGIYTTKQPGEVSWYKPRLESSLALISKLRLGAASPIIDVGAGAATLADDLVERGFKDITVLDISAAALAVSKKRLGDRAGRVQWIEVDITRAKLPAGRYELWHDRAVFHFLTDAGDRANYLKLLSSSLKPGGHAIIAAFDLNGPQKCSGLDIVHYSSETLARELGPSFALNESLNEAHKTPFDTVQNFVYCSFTRLPDR